MHPQQWLKQKVSTDEKNQNKPHPEQVTDEKAYCSVLKLVHGGEGVNIPFQWCLGTFLSTAAKHRPFPGQNQSTLK